MAALPQSRARARVEGLSKPFGIAYMKLCVSSVERAMPRHFAAKTAYALLLAVMLYTAFVGG